MAFYLYNRWRPANRYGTAVVPADAADQRTRDDGAIPAALTPPTRVRANTPFAPRVAVVSRTLARLIRPENEMKNKINSIINTTRQ